MSNYLDIPDAFEYFNKPMRFKGAYGGRGSGKSWSIAALLVKLGELAPLKILCGREYQRSISDSVKSLLDNRIKALNLSHFYKSTNANIEGLNGTSFSFLGLRHEPQKVKSFEGIDIFWGEEANTISHDSLDILIPTVRKEGSELWFTYNRRLVDEPVHQLSRRENADFRKINYDQNPFFPDVLKKEMEFDKKYNFEKYLHIWEGEPQQTSEAQVFKGKYRIESFETPADAQFYYGADWGFSVDPSAVVRCFIDGRRLFIDQEAYKVGVEIQDLPEFFDQVPGTRSWKITADSARPETIRYMQRQGYNVVPAKKGKDSVHDGVEFLKSFEIVCHERCHNAAYELGAYSYKTDRLTGDVLPVLEDKDNHTIDSLRYACESLMGLQFDDLLKMAVGQ